MEIDRPAPGERLSEGPATTPRQSASVIVLRDREPGGGLELLLVRRSPAQRFMGGFWVFPGGAVDAGEGEGDAAHRAAAVRELQEEAGVGGIDPGELVKYSRWITPEKLAIRFDTHFFLVRAPAGARPAVDGAECVDLRWSTPAEALAAHVAGELALVFPTLRHLEELSAFGTVQELLAHARGRTIVPVQPRVVTDGDGARVLLPGEPGYGPE
jgi:8-oxo-dGTP pyrophosphatase MutT (NUDIX family)